MKKAAACIKRNRKKWFFPKKTSYQPINNRKAPTASSSKWSLSQFKNKITNIDQKFSSIDDITLKRRAWLNYTASLWKNAYLPPILNRGFLGAFKPALALKASPSFSVTIHSFARFVSSRPMMVAFIRCSDMTFSKRIQKTNKWSDLKDYERTWTKTQENSVRPGSLW